MKSENIFKKIDSLGRITIPKGIRERMRLGDTVEILTTEENGREFICLAKPVNKEIEDLNKVAEILRSLELDVPTEIQKKIEELERKN